MFLAIALGAFGAHALKARLTESAQEIYKTAVLYHFMAAIGVFVVAGLTQMSQDPKVSVAGILFVIGAVLFSGSLYLLAITGLRWLGAITPLGGLSFLAGWFMLLISRYY